MEQLQPNERRASKLFGWDATKSSNSKGIVEQPGNIGNLPLLGLGLWETVPGSVLLEALLLAIGCFFYFSYALKKEVFAHKGKGIMAGCQ